MIRYLALIDGEEGAYGVSFPDLPGIVAMGVTRDEAILHAEQALRDYAIETERDGMEMDPPSAFDQVEVPPGHTLVPVQIPLRVLVPAEARRYGLRPNALLVLKRMMWNGTA